MDFTPPSSHPIPIPIQATPISSIPSSRKLPIKRKTPNSNSTLILTTPKLEEDDDDPDPDAIARHAPFKFHRIWTEPDEIRLLQGLLDCSSKGLSFPRDLGVFYAQFANAMSQPYSKSQLSEKLRRLRKKFRVISSRLSKGLDRALLSPQDRALYDLSKQLWEPDHMSLPVGSTGSNWKPIDNTNNTLEKKKNDTRKPCLVGVEVSSTAVLALPSVVKKSNNSDNNDNKNNNGSDARDVKVDYDVDVELEPKEVRVKSVGGDLSSGIVEFARTALAEVVDQSLKEMRMVIELQRYSNLEKEISFEKRWRDQRIAEFDVLAKRLKLIMERSSMVSK